jgi:glutamate-1-semialdehyde 2,1-aminomutase
MKILAIVQARLNSQRFPKKVLQKIKGKTLIEILLTRLSKSKEITKIIVATTNNFIDDELELLVNSLGFDIYRGSENDVLDRFYKAAEIHVPEYVVRITADCPMIDSEIVDNVIKQLIHTKTDYCSNNKPPTFPDGFDVEVFTYKSLKKAFLDNIQSNKMNNS